MIRFLRRKRRASASDGESCLRSSSRTSAFSLAVRRALALALTSAGAIVTAGSCGATARCAAAFSNAFLSFFSARSFAANCFGVSVCGCFCGVCFCGACFCCACFCCGLSAGLDCFFCCFLLDFATTRAAFGGFFRGAGLRDLGDLALGFGLTVFLVTAFLRNGGCDFADFFCFAIASLACQVS